MGESIWCTVKVRVPKTWCLPKVPAPYAGRYGIAADAMVLRMPPFVEALAEYLSEGEEDGAELPDGTVLWTLSGEANYGHHADDVQAFLTWCEGNLVPYKVVDDPKYEFGGETVVFDGSEWHHRESNSDSAIVLTEGDWQQLLEKFSLDNGHVDVGLVEAVRKHFAIPDIEDLSIDHLPADYPEEEDGCRI